MIYFQVIVLLTQHMVVTIPIMTVCIGLVFTSDLTNNKVSQTKPREQPYFGPILGHKIDGFA